jgi:capsular exopolysaccharide synthesis family protein
MEGPPEDASLDFSSIFATLARGKWIILVTCIVVAGSIAGYTYTLPAVYQSTSLVRINPQSVSPANISNAATVQPSRNRASEIGLLQNSLDLARRVAEQLRATEEADGDSKSFPILYNSETGESASPHEVAQRILSRTEFTASAGGENIIRIAVESEVPEEASTIANLYAEAYKKFSLEKARASITAARDFLQNQADKQQEKIRDLEEQWKSFAQTNEVVAQGEDGSRVAAQYQQLQSRKDQLRFELEKEQSQLKLLRQQLNQFQPQLEQSVLRSQEASGLRSEIQALEERIAQIRAEAAQYYVANPNLEGDTTRIRNEFPELATLIDRADALQERKRKLTQQLIDQTSTAAAASDGAPLERINQLRNRITEKEIAVNQLQSQIAALDSQITQYESRLDAIPQQRIERNQIERRLQQAESFYQTIVSELQKTAVAEESELGYVEVVRTAFVPSVPVRPDMRQNVILGILLGLGFGIGLAFLREAMNTRLRGPEDIEKSGYDLVGVIPSMDREVERAFGSQQYIEVGGTEISTRLMPLLHPWSSVTENYRLIQANLKHALNGSASPLVITSARQSEGKTTTVANLALTGALSGKRVLVIDADLRRPTLHKLLGLPRSPGLADMLDAPPTDGSGDPDASSTESQLLSNDSCVHKALVDGLYVIPAGVAENAPTEVLDSERIGRLVGSAREHFDVVLIDTPPTRAASDAIVIGAQTKATALVISADESDRRALDSVMKSLRNVGIRVAGVVLNRYDERKATAGGYDDYSYYGGEDYYQYQEVAYDGPQSELITSSDSD